MYNTYMDELKNDYMLKFIWYQLIIYAHKTLFRNEVT